ncbi:MAG TPA: ATP-dependent DNA helicase UvrD2 [Gaiellaceae bacterium]|nr:ATP-dependent DNA helicase UvrD2 [Gaiellaceae bacterium]
MDPGSIFEGLNPEQRRAVEAVRGPVCVLAGAGSGKTTTITRRIANQVATGAFRPTEILAVTFTDKAATEMRERLARLGAAGVPARTFHSAALAQLHYFSREGVGEILSSKALLLKQISRTLPVPFRFRPVGDLATEVEWAKNRRLTPATYLDGLDGHEPPIPPDLMLRVFREYERRKEARARIDFEDVLELAVRLFDEDAEAVETFRARYRAFTVDEYQDVNLLQQSLLERWLGDRDDLCAVGDDYQSIYSFTGATPDHLLAMPERFPRATVVRLEENYRSTPEILGIANRLVPRLAGARKVLRAVEPPGGEPVVRAFARLPAELGSLVERVTALHDEGVPHEELAVLYRINARSEDYEEALSLAGIPYQVRGGAFLARPAARATLRLLRRAPGSRVAEAVRAAADAQGFTEEVPDDVGDEETTRQSDLSRLVRLAEELDDGTSTVADFVADLQARFGEEARGRGVNLLTYHRAKGLEFEAVFLPNLVEGELPFKRADVEEERRLFYVGMTRAKRHLELTWSGKPSRFLRELGALREPEPVADDDPVFKALKTWRRARAREDGIPAFVVFHDKTLEEIARRRPGDLAALGAVSGVGPAKLERYGGDVLDALAGAR